MPPVIVDTSALLAFFDASEPDHDAVSAVLATADVLVVSPYVVAELDYLVSTRHGVDDELAVLDELAGGAWDLESFDAGGASPRTLDHRQLPGPGDRRGGCIDRGPR